MRFMNKTGSTKVDIAKVDATFLLLPNSEAMKAIMVKHDWKYGCENMPGWEVASRLATESPAVTIELWKPFNPFTRAIGYFDGKTIFVNSRKLTGLSNTELVGLLLHEYSHYQGFGHSNNYKTKDKCEHSVPYFLSENTEKWL